MAIRIRGKSFMLDTRHRYPDGRVERIRLAAPPHVTSRRAAEAWERTVLRDLREEIDPRRQERAPEREAPRLRDFWADFIEHQASNANKRKNRPRTLYEAEGMFRRWIDPVLGARRLDQISARDADRLAAAMESGDATGRKLGTAAVANALGLLRRMLSVARRWDLIDRVPEIDASKPRPDKIEAAQWLTQKETTRLLDAAAPAWRPIMVTAFRSGLRLGELRGLRWGDVDLEGQRMQIRRSWDDRTRAFGPPKGGRSREVPLTWDAVATLRGLPRDHADDLGFPGQTGVPFSRTSFARALGLAAKKANIGKHVHPHLTRHTYASHCVAAGIPSRVLMTWGGWQSEAMLARYAHLQPRDVEHWADRIAPAGPLRVVAGGDASPGRGHTLGTRRRPGSKTAS